MIDRVLERGHGHPLALAIVLVEIGRRIGLPVALVSGEHGHFVAHQRLTRSLVLDPATGALTDAGALGTMMWRCGHQVAAELLDLLQPRFERAGDLTRALHVARLRCTLPFEDTQDAEDRLRRVSARLN
jgi:regulator of sirC expression with transglutaminase-like and TPR domain